MKNVLITLLFGAITCSLQAQQSVTITASKDNTLYETIDGSQSNGAGVYLFIGQVGPTGGSKNRRAVIKFDLTGKIPANAVITGAKLKLNMSKSISGSALIKVYRVTQDWGEGTSDASANEGKGAASTTNDATWMHRFFSSQQWTSPGGDFAANPSASLSVSGTGVYTWQDTLLRSDVAAWNLAPAANFGWILIGDENTQSTKRFDSRESATATNRPQLTVDFTTPNGVTGSENRPFSFSLGQNYPNPFNPSSTISFSLPNSAQTSLKIYDILGNEVADLMERTMDAGNHSVSFEAKTLSSGIYFYRLQSGTYSAVKKMIVVK